MKKVISTPHAAAAAMRKQYGEKYGERCRYCCNCQRLHKEDVLPGCIAFGGEMYWDRNEVACEFMFNRPFRGIRPRIKPLFDQLYGDQLEHVDKETLQFSLFEV